MRKVPREAAPEAGRVLNGRALLRCRKCGRENAARALAIDPRFVATQCKGRGCGALTLFPARDVPPIDGIFSLSRPDPGVDARAWDRNWDAMTARMAKDKEERERMKRERFQTFLAKKKQEENIMAATATKKSAPAKVEKKVPPAKKTLPIPAVPTIPTIPPAKKFAPAPAPMKKPAAKPVPKAAAKRGAKLVGGCHDGSAKAIALEILAKGSTKMADLIAQVVKRAKGLEGKTPDATVAAMLYTMRKKGQLSIDGERGAKTVRMVK